MTDLCHRCDRPYAGPEAIGHVDGCECPTCLSSCWSRFGQACDPVDWRARALEAGRRLAGATHAPSSTWRLVVIESPFAGRGDTDEERAADAAENLRYLRAAMADCLARGEAPFASHGLYTQPGVLDDSNREERSKGIAAGFAWRRAAAATVVYEDRGSTSGMITGIANAAALVLEGGHLIEYRRIPGWDEFSTGEERKP